VGYSVIKIKSGKEYILGSLHPWIFSQALAGAIQVPDGEIVDIVSSDGKKFLARGYYNSHSQIAVRILTRNPGRKNCPRGDPRSKRD